MTQQAIASRGIILSVSSEELWHFAEGFFFVEIQISANTGAFPRSYKDVPWPYNAGLDFWSHVPKPGDFVDVVFKGGSTELPTVVAHHPGDATSEARVQASRPRTAVPSQGILDGVENTIGTAVSAIFSGLPILSNFFK